MTNVQMLKGHGTGNDFVIVPDLDGAIALTPAQVRLLCDRHRGIGADGVLRVVRVASDAEARQLAASAGTADGTQPEWFMDYRNADGSIAEMCGNGVRVYAQYLAIAGLLTGADGFSLLTRGGVVQVRPAEPTAEAEPRWTVEMGRARMLTDLPAVQVGEARWSALAALEIPNPHVVVQLPDAAAIDALELWHAPQVSPALPHGQNVEFVALSGPRQIAMRVFERGVGETQSCGTGICAAAVAIAASAGGIDTATEVWRVDVPGGTCEVTLHSDGRVDLTGPAVLVAELVIDAAWLPAA